MRLIDADAFIAKCGHWYTEEGDAETGYIGELKYLIEKQPTIQPEPYKGGDNMSIREDVELYTKLSGEDGSQETIATIGAYLRGYRQGKEDAEPHWIPCSERLPKEECECLVTIVNGKKKYVLFCEYDPIMGFYPHGADDYISTALVAAWMKKPEPYKGVTE